MFYPKDTHDLTRMLAGDSTDRRFVYGEEKSGTCIDLLDVPELQVIRQNCCSLASLTIGCSADPVQVTQHPLIRHYYPVMAQACTQLLQARPGTRAVGVSIFAREPYLWAAMVALGCKALIMDPQRKIRSILLQDLFDENGTLQVAQNEVVTGFNLPRPRFTHCTCGCDDEVSLSIFVHIEDEGIAVARIVLTQPDRRPMQCVKAAQQLLGYEADEYPQDELIANVCAEAATWCSLPAERLAALTRQVWNGLDCVY